jgi:predicted nuclease of predicted toxin-antitoxin system
VRFLADSNIVAMAVHELRALGHTVTYVAERDADPGDLAILSEAFTSGSVLLTKDHDIGALVFKHRQSHAGVLLIDDLGSAHEETNLVCALAAAWPEQFAAGAFVRAGRWGHRLVATDEN